MPAAARIVRAFSSVPDFGAPTEIFLPLRSASVLMPGVRAGHDLDVVGVDCRDAAQLFERRLEPGFLVAFPRVGQRVAERERHFAAPGLQQVQVLDRGLGRLDRGLQRRHGPADVVGERDTQRVIDAARAAGQHVDELLRRRRTRREQQRRGRDEGDRNKAAQDNDHASSGSHNGLSPRRVVASPQVC